MKWVFYILCVVNAGYLAWQLRELEPAPAVSPPAIPEPDYVNRLLLLSEVDRDELTPRIVALAPVEEALPAEVAGIVESSVVDAPALERVCYSIGPLDSEDETTAMRVWLEARNGVANLRIDERRELALYWVFLPPMVNRGVALRRAEHLRGLGVDDIYIIPRGDMANAISLGVFSRKSSLERRLRELRSKSFDPSIGSRYKTTKASWFDVIFPVAAPLSVPEFTRKFATAEVVPSHCSAEQIASIQQIPYNSQPPGRRYFYSDPTPEAVVSPQPVRNH